MNEFLEWLNQNQWLNLVFLILAIIGIIVSIISYVKTRKKKIPNFDKRSVNVISDSIKQLGDIKVEYKGDKIENLTLTKIAFWNGGKDTLNNTDQAPTDKLRLKLNTEYEILDSEIIYESHSTNNLKLIKEQNTVFLNFDYFDYNQGGVIKCLHTGKSSSDVQVCGTFKGSSPLKEINVNGFSQVINLVVSIPFIGIFNMDNFITKSLIKIFPWTLLATGIGFWVVYLLYQKDSENSEFFIFIGAIYTFLGLWQLFTNKSLPKGFEVFFDDE